MPTTNAGIEDNTSDNTSSVISPSFQKLILAPIICSIKKNASVDFTWLAVQGCIEVYAITGGPDSPTLAPSTPAVKPAVTVTGIEVFLNNALVERNECRLETINTSPIASKIYCDGILANSLAPTNEAGTEPANKINPVLC